MIARLVASVWFRALLSAAILAYLATQIDLRAAGGTLVDVDVRYLLGALALDALARAGMILRWVLLLRASHVPVTVRFAARIFLISAFVGTALPTGGTDAARAYALSRHTANGREAVASVAIDRLLGVLAILGLGTLGLLIWTRQTEIDLGHWRLTMVLLIAVAVACAFWADRVLRLALPCRWQESRIGDWLLQLGDAVGRYRGRGSAVLAVFALSLAVQWLRVLEVYCLGRGLDIGVGFAYYLVFMPIGLLVLMLPVSIAGFGLPQGVIVWLLRPVGVPDERSFALSTLFVVTGLIGSLPGLWLYLGTKRT